MYYSLRLMRTIHARVISVKRLQERLEPKQPSSGIVVVSGLSEFVVTASVDSGSVSGYDTGSVSGRSPMGEWGWFLR